MRLGTHEVALAVLALGAWGCDGSHFDQERIAAPAAYDERGGEIVSHGRESDERTIASLCPHGHVTGASRSIVVALQVVPHPIGESSPMASDRVPVTERRVSFACASPPIADAAAPEDGGDGGSAAPSSSEAHDAAADANDAGAPVNL